jgi:hypothetical protein
MRHLLILLLFGAGQGLYAQTVMYDWHARRYLSSDSTCVRAGRMVTYQITNVNTFAQTVRIDGTVVVSSTDMPAEFATLFRIKAETEKKLDNTQNQVAKMEEVQRNAGNTVATAATELVKLCSSYYYEANRIKDAIAFQKQLTDIMADKSFYNASEMRDALASRGIDPASISALHAGFSDFMKAYSTVYAQYGKTAIVAHAEKDKESEVKIDNAQEQVKNDYQALKDQYRETLAKIDDLYAKATRPDNYTVSANPLKVGSSLDEVIFTAHIGEIKFADTLKVTGSWKIDYSVGLTAKFISDDKYYFDGAKTLQQRDNAGFFNTITPGVAPMLHLYRRTCKDVAWGGMFGINADFKEITDINLGFLAGGSIIIGETQKAILSGGLSYSNVNRLKAGEYNVGKVYTDTSIESVTERVLRPSFFLAFSLAISKRKVVKID